MAVIEQVSIGSLAQGAVPPGYTFTRSTTALYVDSDGLLKWSAHNLLLRSEEFDNAAWTKSTTTVTANATTAPDGTTTADKLIPSVSTSAKTILQDSGITTGVLYTQTVYAKAAELAFVQLATSAGFTIGAYWNFDLSTGSIASSNPGTSSASIESVGGGWYRLQMTEIATATTAAGRFVICALSTGSASRLATMTGDGTSGIYLWGAQLNYGPTATAYLPTTSAARYGSPRRQWDATNRRWGYVGEGSRTNVCPYSNDVSNLAWTNYIQGSGVTPVSTGAYAMAPDGTMTATRVDLDCGGSTISDRCLRRMQYASATIGVSYSGAIWLKAATAGDVGKTVRVHLENAGPTNVIYTLTADWVRVLLNAGSATATSTSINLYVECRGTYSSQAASVLMWGGQIEAGPAASSYIPTTTIALSRGADLLTRALTGPEGTALSTQGTMVVEFSYLGGGSTIDQGSRTALEINNATTAERIRIYNLSGTPTVHVVDGGANQSFQSVTGSPTVNAGVITRVGVSWALNDVSVCVDGSAVATDATATMPTVTTIGIGGYPSSNTQPLFGLIYGWTIYDDAKTDAELQVLSSQTKRGVGHWRTLDGTHRTAASPDKTVAIILEAECDLNTAGLDGIERVEFHYNVNGGSTTKVTKTARELLTYNCTDGSLNGLTKTWAYGFLLDCTVVAVGTIVVRATIFDNAGGVHQVPAEITVYNDTDGTDRRPSSAVVYYDHDAGDDTTGTGTTGNPFKTIRAAMNSLSGEVGGSTIRAKTRTVGCTASGSYSSSAIYTTGAWALTFEAVGSDKTIQRLTPGTFSDPQDYILGVDNTSVSRHLNLRFKDFEFVGPGPTVYANDRKVRVDEINCLYRSHAWTSSDTKPHVDYEEFGSGGIAFSTNTASVCRIYSWGGKWRGVGRGPQAYSGLFDFSVGPFLGVAIGTANNFGNDPCYTNGEVFGVRYIVGELDGLIQTNPNFTQLAGVHVTVSIQATGPHTGKMRIDATDSTPNDFGTAAQQLVGSTRWGVTVGSATTGANNGTFAALEGGLNGLGRPYCILNNASAVPEVGSAGFNMDTGALVGGARYIDAVHTDVLQIEADHNDAMFAHIRAWDCHNTRTWVGSGRTLRTCIFKNLSDGDSSGAFDFGSGSTTLLDCLFLSLSVASTAISFVGTFTGTNFVDCVWAAGTNIPTSGTFLHSNHYIVTSAGGTAPSTGVWFNSTPSNAPFDYSPSPGNRGTASGLQDAPPFWYHTGAVAASRGAWKNVATGNWSTSLGSGGGSTAKIPYLGLGVRVGFL